MREGSKSRHRWLRLTRRRTLVAAAVLAAVVGLPGVSLRTFGAPDKQSKEEKKREKAIQKESESPYKKWIEQEVPYIITDEERQTFKKLATDEERESFIENFWERRNPNPGNPENEFKEEYYRRIAYANEHYASGIPGWKTDRGRIYIMYGPPNEVDSHPSGGTYERPAEEGGGETSTFPFEDWTYNYIDGIGNNIQLEFVDPTMSGEYHLTMDPGEKDALLHVPGAGLTLMESMGMASKADRFTRTDGMTIGQSLGGTPESMEEFTRLDTFAKIFKPPVVKFDDLKATVTHKISSQILPFDVRTDFIRITEDAVLTPITVQVAQKDLEFQNKEGVMHGVLDIYGQLISLGGRVVNSFDDSVVVDVPEHDFQTYVNRKQVYQKAVPLRPGHYKLSLVIKDQNSGNIGALDLGLVVPHFDEDRLASSSLILADLIQQLPTTQVGTGPFVIGGTKVRPSVTKVFNRDQDLGIYMQVYNLTQDPKTHKTSGEIQYDLTRDGKSVFSRTEPAQTAQVTIEKKLPLKSLEPGQYTLQVRVTDNVSKQSVVQPATFQLQ
ncbi:MAG TPA: GWxTD domain-containing protein [Terriglobia bacterium]|nr:GWxTD domain-containing protein [Terriglobia bacterium]